MLAGSLEPGVTEAAQPDTVVRRAAFRTVCTRCGRAQRRGFTPFCPECGAMTDVEYDLDHVALLSANPEETAAAYGSLGFASAPPGPSGAPRVEVGGAWVEFHPGQPGAPEKPLLNHLAVLVDSADEHIAAANGLGVEIDDVVDAPNTLAVFLWGPERVRVEYVEHKPTFSLT